MPKNIKPNFKSSPEYIPDIPNTEQINSKIEQIILIIDFLFILFIYKRMKNQF